MRSSVSDKNRILLAGGFHKVKSLALSLIRKGYKVTVINKNYADCHSLAEIQAMEVIYGDASKTVALVNDPKKTEFFYSMGIDSVVCAINVVAGIIEQQAFMDEMATRIPLGSGRVGITEVFISPTAPAAEKRIWELDLPRDAIIGCILRGEESMIPRGDNRIFPGDTLVVISTSDQEKEVIRKLTGR